MKKGLEESVVRKNYYFPEQQIKKLQEMSNKTGLSISEIIRRAIDFFLINQFSELTEGKRFE